MVHASNKRRHAGYQHDEKRGAYRHADGCDSDLQWHGGGVVAVPAEKVCAARVYTSVHNLLSASIVSHGSPTPQVLQIPYPPRCTWRGKAQVHFCLVVVVGWSWSRRISIRILQQSWVVASCVIRQSPYMRITVHACHGIHADVSTKQLSKSWCWQSALESTTDIVSGRKANLGLYREPCGQRRAKAPAQCTTPSCPSAVGHHRPRTVRFRFW